MVGLRKTLLGALLIAALVGVPGAAADPLQFTITRQPASRMGSTAPLPPIAPGFVGVSIDYCHIEQYLHGAGAASVLANLLRALAPAGPVLRIGGEGPSERCPWARMPTAAPVIRAIDRLLARLPTARVILGINFKSHRPQKARRQVIALLRGIDRRRPYKRIAAFEIGNEPDFYPRYATSPGHPDPGSGFARYLRDFTLWARVIRHAARDPALGVAGPSLGSFGVPWLSGANIPNFVRFVDGPAHPTYVTFHTYALFGVGVPCPRPGCPSIENLMADSASLGLAAQLAPLVARVPFGTTVRVDEINSITGGGTYGVANTFSAALWALDTTFEMALAGAGGVNFHTFSSAGYALFSHHLGRAWLIRPIYYGLLMFERAAPAGSWLLSVTPDAVAPGAANVKVWATRSADGRTRVLIINKDTAAQQVLLSGNGLPGRGNASLQPLVAPPVGDNPLCPIGYLQPGFCANDGVTLGGQTFGPPSGTDGDVTTTGSLGPRQGGCAAPLPTDCRLALRSAGTSVTVPAGSALLLVS